MTTTSHSCPKPVALLVIGLQIALVGAFVRVSVVEPKALVVAAESQAKMEIALNQDH